MSAPPTLDERVELLVFEMSGARLAVDAAQVVQIARGNKSTVGIPGLVPVRGGRALVFRTAAEDLEFLQVDAVHGMRTVPAARLRRMPVLAMAPAQAIGLWLDDEAAVVLVDLVNLPKA